jgi:hypothetical protein
MGTVVRPVFGQPCIECEEQVPQARIRALEEDQVARFGHIRNARACIICINCARTNEARERRARAAERDSDITIIRHR